MSDYSLWTYILIFVSAMAFSMTLQVIFHFLWKRWKERKERIDNETFYDLWINNEYMLMYSKLDCKKKYEELSWEHSKKMEFDKEKRNCHITVD